MNLNTISENVDIYQLPAPIEHQAEAGIEITIGDMHGNAIKLMFMLVKHGVATKLTEENYQRLVAIYKMPTENLTKAILEEFNDILSTITFNKHILIRLIGDELADRGNNDYFTLKILEKLNQHQVPLEIILSNHSIEFIEACERQEHFHAPMLMNGHANSLENLHVLVDKKIVARDEILRIKKENYHSNLRIISYSLFEESNKIIIHSHAGIGLNTIKALAIKFSVEYRDTTAGELAKTIDNINQVFQSHVQAGTVHTLYTRECMYNGYVGMDIGDSPFEFTLWNRHYNNLERPKTHHGYSLYFVHGHDNDEKTGQNIYNLDNILGKPSCLDIEGNKGKYIVLYSAKYDLALTATPSAENHKANAPFQDKKSNDSLSEKWNKDFRDQLIILKDKGEVLKQRGHAKAAESASQLHLRLEGLYDRLLKEQITFEDFKENSKQEINLARVELEKHRGWKQILGNLALAILGLGFFYGIAGAVHKAYTGNFLFFQTDSANQLDKLENSIKLT